MKKFAIIFNGPPDSGKDFFADLLHKQLNRPSERLQFKDKLFELVLCIYGVDKEEFFDHYNNRKLKEQPWDKLRGLSPRQAMINVSENIIKPNFDKRYFGEQSLIKMEKNPYSQFYIFSDGGFEEELEPFIEAGVEVIVIRLHREGKTYAGDSRRYIENSPVVIVDWENTGEFENAEQCIRILIKSLVVYGI